MKGRCRSCAFAVCLLVGIVGLSGCLRTPMPMRDVMPGEFLVPDGEVLAVDEVGELVRGAEYVLLGEGHSVACDHRVQADVLAQLARTGQRPVLGLEMVPVDLQPVLDRFNAGEIGVDGLEEALDWESTWGHDFRLYEPIFRTAHKLGIPAVALNVPKRVVRAVSKGGVKGVDEADKALMPDTLIPPSDAQREMLAVQFEQHQGMMGTRDVADAQERFMLVQSLWDTAMAGSAAAARRGVEGPVVVLAGSGHVEYGWGIEHRLASLDPGARVVSVLPWRGLGAVEEEGADLYYYCAQTNSSRLGFTLKLLPGAAQVVAVAPGTKADKAGFLAGDRIVEAQGMAVEDLWVLHKAAVQAKKAGEDLVFGVERRASRIELSITLSKGREETGDSGANGDEGEAVGKDEDVSGMPGTGAVKALGDGQDGVSNATADEPMESDLSESPATPAKAE